MGGVTSRRGGGLTVVYRRQLDDETYRLRTSTLPTTFEWQLVCLKSGKKPGIIIANVYRPAVQSTASVKFYDELVDLISNTVTSSGLDVIVCGDLNCAGGDPHTVDAKLASVFDPLNMNQLVSSPTKPSARRTCMSGGPGAHS